MASDPKATGDHGRLLHPLLRPNVERTPLVQDFADVLYDIMSATGHADERMCAYYDRDPNNVARSAVHGVGAYVAGAS